MFVYVPSLCALEHNGASQEPVHEHSSVTSSIMGNKPGNIPNTALELLPLHTFEDVCQWFWQSDVILPSAGLFR